ncbi:hypothetical protein, partial [Shewanella sp.]|uniref:hypothetical protein n=1 Tax=Shewanella sp. TaxID=50422 RepID=UPI003F66B7E9
HCRLSADADPPTESPYQSSFPSMYYLLRRLLSNRQWCLLGFKCNTHFLLALPAALWLIHIEG